MLLQENYLNHRPLIASDEAMRLKAIAKAAASFSAGDVVNTAVRKGQVWSLAPASCFLMGVMPCAYMRGSREPFGLYPGEMNFPRFTAWLGNFSTSNKQRRLLGEISTTMASSGHVPSHR